jgi:hypothetical protein
VKTTQSVEIPVGSSAVRLAEETFPMTRSPVRRRLFFLAFTLSFPWLTMGCPKKPAPVVVDAGEAPPPASSTVTELAPLTDDGGEDGPVEAEAGKKWGPAVNPNQMKIQACCSAMRTQAKSLGTTSPEGFQLNAMAAQCDVFAKQVGPAGNAPEFNQLRQILKSVKLPSACQF